MREDDEGKTQQEGQTRSLLNVRESQRRRRENSEASSDRMRELRNMIMWRQEDNDWDGRRPGGRRGQQKSGKLGVQEERKEKEGRP
jgi:hypothetical protein